MTAAQLSWAIVLAVVGAIIGSFLGLVSLRLPLGEPIAMSRSRCTGCQRRLSPADLVPVASYLALRGRCSSCGSAIPRRYFGMELASALIGGVAGAIHPSEQGVASAILGWWLLLLAILDAERVQVRGALTLSLLGAGLSVAAGAWPGWPHLPLAALAAAVLGAALTLRGDHRTSQASRPLFATIVAAAIWALYLAQP